MLTSPFHCKVATIFGEIEILQLTCTNLGEEDAQHERMLKVVCLPSTCICNLC